MLKRKKDINALVEKIKSHYGEIEVLYKSALQKKEIGSELQIEVKNYLENARSVLDYCAHDIADVFEINACKIYFPIVGKDQTKTSFDGSIGRNLPGLESKNKQVFDYLESIQPYHQNNFWLADFVNITVDTKHSQLTPQTRIETERITSEHVGGGRVSWNPCSVKFGSGVLINGASVNPYTQMPVETQETIITKEIWVDFRFDDKISVLPLLKKIYDKIPEIINQIYKNLE